MKKEDIESLALELQKHTAMSRLNLAEARKVVERLLELGFIPPVPKAAVAS